MPSANGRLSPQVLEAGARVMIEDIYERVEVFRENAKVSNFQTRIGTASRSIAGRDQHQVQGASSPEYSVMLAPLNTDLRADDEAWIGTRRYRILSVDPQPHRLQVLLLNLQ